MTNVRSKRSHLVHVTADLRKTLCGRKADGWLIEPDQAVTCLICHIASTTN